MPVDFKHKSRLNKKWKALEKRGYKRPQSSAENLKRIKEAHHGG